MNWLRKGSWSFIVVLLLWGGLTSCGQAEPEFIIFDTDISSDVDDVGAVAVLHSLADENRVQILSMAVSSGDPWSVSCLMALNSWYGRPEIPVGQVKGPSVVHESKYTEALSREFGEGWIDEKNILDAVSLYRKTLAASPDNSVTIITVGYLTNLSNILSSLPDEYSPMTGKQLVALKVKKLITMGGQYPEGREWNFYQDTAAAKFVVALWPSAIDFIGYETGVEVLTGAGLNAMKDHHPVARAYELYNDLSDRPSWDQIAVLASLPEIEYNNKKIEAFLYNDNGRNVVFEDGANKWNFQLDARHRYMKKVVVKDRLSAIIESRMMGEIP